MKLNSSFDQVLIYEDSDLQRKALRIIPVDRLRQEANIHHNSYKLMPNMDELPFDFNDFYLIELLAWFKNEFFKWTNQAECESCGNPSTRLKMNSTPNHSEATWMAGNVEVYE